MNYEKPPADSVANGIFCAFLLAGGFVLLLVLAFS